MSKAIVLIAAVLALALPCGASFALGRVVAYEELPFSTVTSVATCGRWDIDGELGEFRVLQGYLYGGTMLFVDMVGANKRGTWLEVTKGFTFAELNNDHLELELSDVGCASERVNKITITGRATPFEGDSYSFTIEIDGPAGTYRIRTGHK